MILGHEPVFMELLLEDGLSCFSVAPIWRDNVQVVGKASWGAHLRMREVTGRDASLPAPLWASSFELVAHGTVGALPQTPPEALPLDSARGNFPLDPFRAIELVSLPLLLPRVALLGVSPNPIPYHFMNQVEIYPVLPSTSTLHQSVPCSSTFTSVPTGTRASTSALSDAPLRKFT